MKKENLILVLSFVVMFILGIVLVSVQTFLPSTPVDKMFNQKVNIINEKTVIDTDYINIRSKADVTNLNNEKLADLYTITVNHKTYFDLELYVAIDENGKVYAIDKSVKTNDSTSESYFKLVRNYLLQNYNGLYYENVEFIDGAAGATTIGVSRSMIKNAVSQVIIYHIGEPVNYIGLLLNNENYAITSQSESNGVTIYNVTVAGNPVKVYKATGEGTFYDRNSVQTAAITIYMALNSSNEITHVLLPEDLYGHTGGSFYTKSKTYFDGFVGQNIQTGVVDFTAGPTDNSDGSQYLINQLVQKIKGVTA